MTDIQYVYVAPYERSNEWTRFRADTLGTIKDNVLLLVYKTIEDKRVASGIEKSLSKVPNKRIIDLSKIEKAELNSAIMQKIEECTNNDAVIYVLCDRTLYDGLKNGTDRIQYANDIGVANKQIKIHEGKAKQNKSGSMGENLKRDGESLTNIMASFMTDEDFDFGKPETDKSPFEGADTKTSGSDNRYREEKRAENKDSRSEQKTETKSEQKSDRKPEFKKEAKNTEDSNRRDRAPEAPPRQKESESEEEKIRSAMEFRKSLRAAERNVFGIEDKKTTKQERIFTDMDLSKAQFVEKVFVRFTKNLDIYIKDREEQTISRAHYTNFLVTLLKSYDYNDFINSWMAVKNFNISITEEEYKFLKDEALYYSDLCTMVYEKDKWQ